MATLKRKIPAEITPEQDEYIRKIAVDAFRYLGCNGVTRIDFMIDMATDKIYINEINTIPGLARILSLGTQGRKVHRAPRTHDTACSQASPSG